MPFSRMARMPAKNSAIVHVTVVLSRVAISHLAIIIEPRIAPILAIGAVNPIHCLFLNITTLEIVPLIMG